MKALEAALLAAHAAGDSARLVRLYEEAADQALAEAREDACGFFLTQAYILALEAGAPRAGTLKDRLIAMGRESPN